MCCNKAGFLLFKGSGGAPFFKENLEKRSYMYGNNAGFLLFKDSSGTPFFKEHQCIVSPQREDSTKPKGKKPALFCCTDVVCTVMPNLLCLVPHSPKDIICTSASVVSQHPFFPFCCRQ